MLRHRYMKNTGSLRRITFGILFFGVWRTEFMRKRLRVCNPNGYPTMSYTNWDFSGSGQRQLRSNSPNTPDKYTSVLKARTLPFADNIFKVRDTLVSDMQRNKELLPIYYAKLADENGTYRKDEVNYTYDGNSTTGNIRLYRPKRNAIEDYTLTEPGIVYDMLSIFYVIRTFDFRAMEMYQIYNTKIFSGKNLEHLEIEYLGQEILKQNKKEYSTYKLRFRFYDRTGKKDQRQNLGMDLYR